VFEGRCFTAMPDAAPVGENIAHRAARTAPCSCAAALHGVAAAHGCALLQVFHVTPNTERPGALGSVTTSFDEAHYSPIPIFKKAPATFVVTEDGARVARILDDLYVAHRRLGQIATDALARDLLLDLRISGAAEAREPPARGLFQLLLCRPPVEALLVLAFPGRPRSISRSCGPALHGLSLWATLSL
jgi:hypothetical protein